MKMIKYNPVIFKMLFVGSVLAVFTSGPGYCQYEEELGYSLIIEASPIDTGFVNPEPGVHRFGLNETVVIKAVPKPGYRFLYWLGDVDDPIANETTINLDSPKIVIAVFERDEFSLMSSSVMPQKGSGSGGAVASANRFRPNNPGVRSSRGAFPPPVPFILPEQNMFPIPEDGDGVDDEDLFPVPGDEDLFPVPGDVIPEPATIALFGFGWAIMLKRKRRG